LIKAESPLQKPITAAATTVEVSIESDKKLNDVLMYGGVI